MIETLTLAELCRPQTPLVLTPGDPVAQAIAAMGERRLSSVVIVAGETPVGIFTERDALGLLATATYRPETPLGDLMSPDPVSASPDMTFVEGYACMAGHGVRHLVLTDAAGRFHGVLSETDFAQALGAEDLQGPRTVADLMTREPVWVAPTTPVAEALALMARRRISSVLVVEGARALGILTERDAIRLAGADLDLHATPVCECMSQPLHTIGPDRLAHEVATRMRALGVRHLVVEDAAGRLVGILGRRDLLRDIQDIHVRLLRRTVAVQGQALHDARAQLREQGLLRAMFEASPVGISLRDRDGRLVLVNPALLAMLGYENEPETPIGRHYSEFVAVDGQDETAAFARLLAGEGPDYRLEKHYRHRDGQILVAEVSVNAIRDATGTVTHALSMVNDVSEQRLWAGAFQHCAHGLAIGNPRNNTIAACNQAFADLIGTTPEMIAGQPIPSVYAPEDLDRLRAHIAIADRTGRARYEARMRRRDGTTFEVQMDLVSVFAPDDQVRYRVATMQDISERVRAQAALVESESRLRLFIAHAPAALAMFDHEMRYLAVSRRWLDDFGLREHETLGCSHYALFPEIPPRWREVHRRALAGEVLRADEDRFERRDGSVQWVRWETRPWYAADGTIGGIVIFNEDITARRQAEVERDASRAILAAALESMMDAVFISDAEGNLIEFNEAFARCHRFRDKTECPGMLAEYQDILEIYAADGTPIPVIQWGVYRALRGEFVPNAEYEVRRKDTGETWFGSYSAAPICDPGGAVVGMVAVGRDVTERRRIERDLLAAGERYRVLAETMLQGVVHQGADGTILAMNPAAERILGKTREQILGSSSVQEERDCIREDGSPFPGLEHPAMVALRTGEPQRGVVMGVFNPQRGKYRWIRIDAVPLRRGDESAPSEVYTIFEDITEWRQVQESLRTSEARHRALVEASFDWIWEVDERAIFTYTNSKVTEILGYSPEEIIGRSPFDLMALEEAWRVGALFAAIQARRESFRNLEHVHLHKDGRQRVMESSAVPIMAADGSCHGYRGFCRDVTDLNAARQVLEHHQKELEDLVAVRTSELTASEERLRLIMDSSADGIIGVDTAGAVTFTNAAAESLLGYGPGDLLGRNLVALVDRRGDEESEPPAGSWPIHQAIHTGQTVRVDSTRFRRADGTNLDVTFSIRSKRRDGAIVGAVITFSDATLRREAEQAREQARVAAERLARLKSEFLANMSHEIRTPLNGVLGMAQVGYRASGAQPRLREHFARILTSGKLLLSVVNDILDFSKLEAGKLEIERLPFDPGQVVDQVVASLGDTPAHQGLRLRVRKSRHLPAACLGDAVRLTQVLINLLGNAIKFTERGQVILDIAWTQGWLVLRVTDTGIGMDAEQLARLFRPFEQADSGTTRRFGGTGLGLTITHRLVEMMGGRIRVHSTPGQGTRFRIVLPAPAVAATALSPVADRPVQTGNRRLAGLRLLVAEDNEVNRAVLEALLSDEGAAVTLVENGRQALEAVGGDGAVWDLVLMDVQMPEMDGLEATRRIRALAPDLPIVGQTAHALAEELEKCRAAGMVDRVAKPIEHEALVAAVLRHARRGGPAVPAVVVPVTPADTPADSPVDIPADLPAPAESMAGRIDWAALHAHYAHNPAFVDRIVGLALKGHQELPAQLRGWAADGQLEALGRAAHALKGVAGSLMAPALAELAGRTQLAAQDGSPEAPTLARQLAEALERFLADLRAHPAS